MAMADDEDAEGGAQTEEEETVLIFRMIRISSKSG